MIRRGFAVGTGESTARHRPGRRVDAEGGAYVPPAGAVAQRLEDLIGGVREIAPAVQGRLGLSSDEGRLWCAGDVSLVGRPSVAIVGTRDMSTAGAARARRLARELGAAGIVVVSGLARGIDTEALTSAIDSGGRVIAVLGTPIDQAYPAENRRLQERVYQEHLLISQFPSGGRVYRSNFPDRNRLMAAITDATAIIEASDSSGTLHQAAECVRLGRWLFIAKSLLDDPDLRWPAKFRTEPRVRTLSESADILSVLRRAA